MSNAVISIGNEVRITSYGPFRGLKGMILAIDRIVDDQDDPFCFYLVALIGASVPEPVWLEYHEVEFIGLPAVALQPQLELTGTAAG